MDNIAAVSTSCRICQATDAFESIMDFGELALTGVFELEGINVPRAPLELVMCENCKLVQLRHNYNPSFLYGETYGYESSLNSTMVSHLHRKARILEKEFLESNSNQVVVDIASNDGTFLQGFISRDLQSIGIDPLINYFTSKYPPNSKIVPEFFTAKSFYSASTQKATLVTSMSVIYDLEDPIQFARDVAEILEDGGIWHFEQSYLPSMVSTLSYDTICHEHLLYLTLHDIKRLLEGAGLQLIDASLNSVNGGSIAVTARKANNSYSRSPFVDYLLLKEVQGGYTDGSRMKMFKKEAEDHRESLGNLISSYAEAGFEIVGLGASTKGNVLLQWLGADRIKITKIGDVNPKKFGKSTPGTGIRICSDVEALEGNENQKIALVLPWHFKDGIISKSESFLGLGGHLLFPLPSIEVITG